MAEPQAGDPFQGSLLAQSRPFAGTVSPRAAALIRPMRPEDLEAAVQIDRLSFSLPWPENAFRYELYENPGSSLWVAEMSGTAGTSGVVGVIVTWLIVDEAHIATLAVHPDCRRQGLAREMLAVALQEAIHRKMILATLEVRSSNQAAQQLYRHFGFEVAGQRPRYYRDNLEDALIMTVSGLDETYLQWLESKEYRARPARRENEVDATHPADGGRTPCAPTHPA